MALFKYDKQDHKTKKTAFMRENEKRKCEPMEYQLLPGRPADTAGRLEKEIQCYDLLDSLGIRYERIDHPTAPTMDDLDPVARALGCPICKNLFLCNRQQTRFYMLVLPAGKHFKTKELSGQLGVARLSFAGEELLGRLLGLTPGSVTVLGLMNDPENKVQLLIDKDVAAQEIFACHPCINTSSIRFATADLFEKLLPALGHSPIMVELGGEE